MKRSTALKLALAATLAGGLAIGTAQAAETLKIGAVAPKTGPLAGGSTVTHWPNIRLWVEQVNRRGGLKLKSGMAKIELIEYDDQTNPGENIKAVQRLATQDKADTQGPLLHGCSSARRIRIGLMNSFDAAKSSTLRVARSIR